MKAVFEYAQKHDSLAILEFLFCKDFVLSPNCLYFRSLYCHLGKPNKPIAQ